MRFLLDGMLGKLARWLRLLGYEAVYANNSSDSNLIRKAKEEEFTLLTSDIALYRLAVARGVESYLIKGRTEPERLARLARRFKVRLAVNPPKSLCTTCGGSLRKVERSKIKGRVPLTTFKTFRNFWECTESSCGKVYWQGSHWKNIKEVLTQARKLRREGS